VAQDLWFPTVGGARCRGTLHGPTTGRTSAPCVVLANGVAMGRRDGVHRFAEAFATAGVSALTYDPRHLGDSDGEPRDLIDVRSQVEDLEAAVSHVRAMDGMDGSRVALWGYSLGGGVALEVAARDPAVAAAVLLCPVVDGLAFTLAGDRRNNVRVAAAATAALVRRQHLRLPLTAAGGEPAVFTQSEVAPGFAAVVDPGSTWSGEIRAAPTRLVASFRPVRRASQVRSPLLASVGTRDRVVPRRAIERVARRAPAGRLSTHDMDHFGAFGERFDEVAGDHVRFLCLALGLPAPVEG